MADVILGDSSGEKWSARAGRSTGEGTPWLPLLWIGVALGLVGLIDVALVWVPLNLGTPEWEFGTVSRTMNGLGLATLGIGAVAVAASAAGRRSVQLAVAALAGVVTMLLLAAGLLYGLAAPVAWQGAPAGVRPSLGLAIAKTVAYAVIYITLYSWLTVHMWGRFGRSPMRRRG